MATGSNGDVLAAFEAAAARVRAPTAKPLPLSNDDKLMFYALYKQATLGSVREARVAPPSVLSAGFGYVVEKAKYDAWAALGSMSRADAARSYVGLVAEFEARR
jgi:diazepam-binding inhibitor (GABA receptor modulating acyl-CoA-binding protein)